MQQLAGTGRTRRQPASQPAARRSRLWAPPVSLPVRPAAPSPVRQVRKSAEDRPSPTQLSPANRRTGGRRRPGLSNQSSAIPDDDDDDEDGCAIGVHGAALQGPW